MNRVKSVRRLTVALAGLACLMGTACAVEANPGTATRTKRDSVQVDGIKRTYAVHVPPEYEPGLPTPLVVVMHGGGGSGRRIERYTRFSELADKEGFLVVYPDAVDRHWNDGRKPQIALTRHEDVDDVAFVAALLDELAGRYTVDPDRVFVTGPSNGGMMTHLLAAKLADRLAAVAPVIAGMPPAVAEDFKPARPVSVLMINGTADKLVPLTGGGVGFRGRRGEVISTAETVAKWVAHNGCNPEPQTVDLPDTDPNDGTRVKRATYTGGRLGTEVVVYTVEGGGHTWPGATPRGLLVRRLLGPTSRDIDASTIIWEFFSKHPRRKPSPPKQ